MRIIYPLMIISALLVGGTGGYVAGKYRTGLVFEKLFVLGEANAMTSRVQVLSAIRKGQSKEAVKWLEYSVDRNLIILGPYKEIALKENNAVILSSLKLASIYRNLYKDIHIEDVGVSTDSERRIKETLAFGNKYGEPTHKDFIETYLNPDSSNK